MVTPGIGYFDSLGRHPLFMVSFLFPLLIATILGFLAGMGVGGGSLLLLWLTQVVNMPHPQARILNLLFYLPSAIIASVLRIKRTKLPLNIILPGLVSGCVCAAVFTIISVTWNTDSLKKVLGWLLIAVGLREIFYRPRKAR